MHRHIHRRGTLAAALVAVTAFVLSGCTEGGPDDARPDRVMRIEATPCDRPQPRLGAGTEVADGIVLTAAHVVDGDLRELLVDGEPASVVGIEVSSDLALVAFGGSLRALPSWDLTAAHDIGPGPIEIVTTDGSIVAGLVRTLTLRVEDVSAGRTVEREAIELDVVVEEGDSGSPVVDGQGRLLGVVVLRRPSASVSYASRVPAFDDLLDSGLYQELLTSSTAAANDRSLAGSDPCT
jgi:S1-C subfamily serine protease